jgi:putative membrane-bound dehydrogenase-like protein
MLCQNEEVNRSSASNRFVVLLAPLALLCWSSMLPAAPEQVADPKALPKFPPVAAPDALNTFQLRKGFRMELVAAEPLVTEPIALAFDEDGRLFVVAMNDFPEGDKQRPGQVKRLEDTDGDGRFDKATVFADGLHWPSAVHCYGGGVFVAAVPDLLFCRDTNDDGVADQTQVVLTGWGNRAGTLDPEGVFGSLAWGLDNRIHGLVNRYSGVITNPRNPDAKPVTLGGNFAFDPRTMTLVAEGGEGQYGMGFNDDGRQFLCRQHRHIMTHLFDRRYADRNPWHTMPDPTVDIAVDGPKAALYRISPEEPWRVMRTKWRFEALEEGIEAGGRASGYFSAACGLTIYRGNAWPREYVGDAFVADPAENVVHHKKVTHSGPNASAERPPMSRESSSSRRRTHGSGQSTWPTRRTGHSTSPTCTARGPVKAPWLSWGPYFWSYPDGTPRNHDGFVWTMADVVPDLLHPSLSGLTKYANLFLHQMATDSTATPWFLNPDAPPNKLPVIAKAASAGADPVSGPTTTLSVLGADDGGEPGLTYTWSCSGPAGVTFSVNGPNKSKNTTATFPGAGRYTFHVTIADNGGLTATSSIAVTVTPR